MTVDGGRRHMSTNIDHWSKTSFDLFCKCPRAWAIAYANKKTSSTSAARRGKPTHRLSDLAIRAARRTLLEELSDLYNNKRWTEPYTLRRIKAHMDEQVWTHRIRTDSLIIEGLAAQISHRLKRLRQTDLLKPIWAREPRRWAFFERTNSIQIGGLDLYATPDIVVYHQHKWTLFRLRFQSGHPLPSRDLEDALMVHWAMHQSGLPDRVEDYRIRTLTWVGGEWIQGDVEINSNSVRDAWMMLQHDLLEMNWMKRWMTADPTMESLPLARRESDCKGCRYRPSCPASKGLKKAKKEQERRQIKSSKVGD